MTLDTTLERAKAPELADVVDAFVIYLSGRIEREMAPRSFFREAGIAIQDVLYRRNGVLERFENVPDAYVIALCAYLPHIAERTLSPPAARAIAHAYPSFFSEK